MYPPPLQHTRARTRTHPLPHSWTDVCYRHSAQAHGASLSLLCRRCAGCIAPIGGVRKRRLAVRSTAARSPGGGRAGGRYRRRPCAPGSALAQPEQSAGSALMSRRVGLVCLFVCLQEHRLHLGSKEIFHIEAFVAKVRRLSADAHAHACTDTHTVARPHAQLLPPWTLSLGTVADLRGRATYWRRRRTDRTRIRFLRGRGTHGNCGVLTGTMGVLVGDALLTDYGRVQGVEHPLLRDVRRRRHGLTL